MAAFEDIMLYDGKSFTKIPKADNFKSFDAFDALQDSKGNIWIASTHHGVFLYDGKKFSTEFFTIIKKWVGEVVTMEHRFEISPLKKGSPTMM